MSRMKARQSIQYICTDEKFIAVFLYRIPLSLHPAITIENTATPFFSIP